VICVAGGYYDHQLKLLVDLDTMDVVAWGDAAMVERWFSDQGLYLEVAGTDLPEKGIDYVLLGNKVFVIIDLSSDFSRSIDFPIFYIGESFVPVDVAAAHLKSRIRSKVIQDLDLQT
jgi:hypothetical protein